MWNNGRLIGASGLLLLATFALSSCSTTPKPPADKVKHIPYQIVNEWKIPNGGYGRIILVTRDLVNDSDMVALGLTLKSDNSSDRHSSILVFTDIELAKSPRGNLPNLTDKQWDAYCSNNVASYEKNGNTGNHVYTYCLKGLCHGNKEVMKFFQKFNY